MGFLQRFLDGVAANAAAMLMLISLGVCAWGLYRWSKRRPDDEDEEE